MKKYIILLVTMFAFMITGCCPKSSCNRPPLPKLIPISYSELQGNRSKFETEGLKENELYYYISSQNCVDYGDNYQIVRTVINPEDMNHYLYQLVTN